MKILRAQAFSPALFLPAAAFGQGARSVLLSTTGTSIRPE